MKRLILMRHAKSSWAVSGQADIERPLNERGRRSAALIGRWLEEKRYRPEAALVSVSQRTRETFAGLTEELGGIAARFVPELYNASAETILSAVRGAPEAETVLVLAHQPGTGACARRLLGGDPGIEAFARYPTAATSVIAFEAGRWAAIGWGEGQLEAFICPRELEQEARVSAASE